MSPTEGQLHKQNRTLTLSRRNSMREPSVRHFNNDSVQCAPSNTYSQSPLPANLCSPSPIPSNPMPTYTRMNYTTSELPVENAQLYRRTIRPYTGAKSDGQLLSKHANVSLNVIAAAERKKRQSQCYSQGSEQEVFSNDFSENN